MLHSANEKGFKSQQGRAHLLANVEQMKDENVYIYHVPRPSRECAVRHFKPRRIRCNPVYLESGDKIRALIAETKGCSHSRKDWESVMILRPAFAIFGLPFALRSPRRRDTIAKVSDKRLGIELAAIHENLWQGPQRTWNIFRDRLDWISTHTMLGD